VGHGHATICTLSGLNTSSCQTSGIGQNVYSIAISSDKTVAYLADGYGFIDTCIISGYSLTNCTQHSSASGEMLYINGSTLYTQAGYGSALSICSVNGTNVTSCSTNNIGLNPLTGIDTLGDAIFMVDNNNSPNNNVTGCLISGNVTSSCASTQLLDNYPFGIAIYNSTAFITSTQNSKVTSCTISGQSLTNCAHTISAVKGYGIHVHDSIAYIATGSSIYGCPIAGSNFTSCSQVLTGLTSAYDFAIA
jgi:hypothetical protein